MKASLLLPRSIVGISAAVIILGADSVSGQTYPNKPIRIVGAAAGSGADVIVRLIVPGISGPLGQPVIVENRTAVIAPEIVSRAPPDGYTLLGASNNFFYGPLLQKMPYDPVRDFAPITVLVTSPSILIVSPTLQVNTVKELIALAKAKPGALNYASSGTGGGAHLEAELFKSMAGVDIVRIAYKGTSAALGDLVGGKVHVVFDTPFVVMPNVKSGKLKALAVTSSQPSALAPGLPTVAESLPGFVTSSITAMFAPAKTPPPIISRLNQEMVRFLRAPEVKEKFFSIGLEVVGNSPDELAAWEKADLARIGKVIKDAGIKTE